MRGRGDALRSRARRGDNQPALLVSLAQCEICSLRQSKWEVAIFYEKFQIGILY